MVNLLVKNMVGRGRKKHNDPKVRKLDYNCWNVYRKYFCKKGSGILGNVKVKFNKVHFTVIFSSFL